MKAMILSAGCGVRLRPITLFIPKAVVPVGGKALLEHNLNWLRRYGITDVVINLHYMPECIRGVIGKGERFEMEVVYSYESKLLGSAGGVKKVEWFFDDTFILMNGDILVDIDLRDAIEYHNRKGSAATMLLCETKNEEFSVVRVNHDGKIKSITFRKDKEMTLRFEEESEPLVETVFTGIHILEPLFFRYIPPCESFEMITQVYPKMIKEGLPVYGYLVSGYWNELGTPARYFQANIDILNKEIKLPLDVTERREGFWMGERIKIHPTSHLTFPIMIGDGCIIGKKAKVGSHVILGKNCVVGDGALLSEAVIWEGVKIESGAKVKRSILSENFLEKISPSKDYP